MILYRFAQPNYATRELAFSGEGGLRYSGRWNHAGALIVYTATTLSLAILEMMVHLRIPVPKSQLMIAVAPLKPIVPSPRLARANVGTTALSASSSPCDCERSL